MFGIGFSEMVLIGLVLIIFIKPEDYPKFLRSAGRTYGKMKKFYNELVMVKDKILKDIDEIAALEESKGAEEEKAADDTDRHGRINE
jgi:Tat protein translocase TatB subunit